MSARLDQRLDRKNTVLIINELFKKFRKMTKAVVFARETTMTMPANGSERMLALIPIVKEVVNTYEAKLASIKEQK
jgi:hypothetical protein